MAKAKGCDVLIDEAYLTRTYDTLSEKLRKYHGANHTSATDLGTLAARVQPGLLIGYHSLRFGAPKTEVVEEIQQHFKGKVVFAEDFDTF